MDDYKEKLKNYYKNKVTNMFSPRSKNRFELGVIKECEHET
jgi:hypothetical protein